MQLVPRRWLTIFTYGLLTIDIGLFLVYFYINQPGRSVADYEHWGIVPLILIIAAIHASYVIFIYPFLRRRIQWLSFIISDTIFLLLFAAIIETSEYTNIYIRIGYIVMIFLTAMSGPFLPIATIALTWVFLLYTYISVLSAISSNFSFKNELILDTIATFAGLLGWLFFKRFYVKNKNKEAIALSKLLEQEQFKTNAMLESISDGVMVINTLGTVQVLNESAATLLGWEKSAALKLDYKSLIQPIQDSAQTLQNKEAASVIERTFNSKKPKQAVVLLRTKNGRQLYVDVVVSPIMETLEAKNSSIKSQEKKLVGVIAVLRDVDEQKRQEQQRSDFISTASHEMRTPVASIQGYLDLILTPKIWQDQAKVKDFVIKARASTEHLSELFDDLLTVSLSDDGRLASKPEKIEISDFIMEVLEPMFTNAKQKGLQVHTDIGRGAEINPEMTVRVDPGQLREVILNLFSNAIKYTEKGSITISTNVSNDYVVIAVSDTGIGIAEEDIPHLFQKFYRTDNSATREIGGTGLGLYLCKQLVESMGGKIKLRSQLGKGSTFIVELPRHIE